MNDDGLKTRGIDPQWKANRWIQNLEKDEASKRLNLADQILLMRKFGYDWPPYKPLKIRSENRAKP